VLWRLIRDAPGELDLLPYLEPAWRAQLPHAVGHVGLLAAPRRIRGLRSRPARAGVMIDADWAASTDGSLQQMPTLVRDPQPVEFEALLERRRRLGQDLFDEVWKGVRHMNPAPNSKHARLEWQLATILSPLAGAAGLQALGQFNLGDEGDYRVPDGALAHPGVDAVYLPTAALVLEIVSPGDETWEKLDFYAARGVDELLIVDPQDRIVSWLGLESGENKHLKQSRLIELGAAELAARIDWP
jgi:Uma2 family endonuclease